MQERVILALSVLAATSACDRATPPAAPEPARPAEQAVAPEPAHSSPVPDHVDPDQPPAPPPSPLAASLVRQEWRRSDNRELCAPIAFTSDGGAPAKARRANFSGGWAVAFDLPENRSAYGIAGPGVMPVDHAPPAAQHRRISAQWPYFLRLSELPQPAYAGFGLEGAQPYPDEAPDGRGRNSVAYVRISGQTCTYNVWSRLGRAHLEVLLQSLRLV